MAIDYTAAERDAWLAKLDSDIDEGLLPADMQSVIDFRSFMNNLDVSLNREDIDWPEYPYV